MPAMAHAGWDVDSGQRIYDNARVTFDIRAGATHVQAHEYAYSGAYKLSELIWDTKTAYMAGGTASILLSPLRNIRFNASFSHNITKGNSVMDDYDWLVVGADWSHWSHHDNTKLEKGMVVDIGISSRLYSNDSGAVELGVLMGYRRDQWRWGAVGGSYVYTVLPGFRNTAGIFPNVPVINYEQTISTPYIGASFDWSEGNFSLTANMIGSPFVSAETVDHHYLRNLIFTTKPEKGSMFGGDIALSYRMTNNAKFGVFYSVQNFSQSRGNVITYDQSTGMTTLSLDSGAMSLNCQTLGAHLSIFF